MNCKASFHELCSGSYNALSILCPQSPPGQCWGIGGHLYFAKFKWHQLLGMLVSKIQTFSPLKNRAKDGEFDHQCF